MTRRSIRFGRCALAAGLIVSPIMSLASDTLRPTLVHIETAYVGDSVTISGVAFGLEAIAVDAELKVERSGAAGNAVLEQHKSIDLVPDARVTFGRISVSFATGDYLVATASLRAGETVIAETRTIIGAGKNSISGGN